MGRRLVLLWIGLILAGVTWFLAYDVSGGEPPCFEAQRELRESHPDAVEFRNGNGDFTHWCEAVAADGTVLGRVTYPGTVGWVCVAVVLFGPLAGDVVRRKYRPPTASGRVPPWPPEAPER
jgi:hypothetical protein